MSFAKLLFLVAPVMVMMRGYVDALITITPSQSAFHIELGKPVDLIWTYQIDKVSNLAWIYCESKNGKLFEWNSLFYSGMDIRLKLTNESDVSFHHNLSTRELRLRFTSTNIRSHGKYWVRLIYRDQATNLGTKSDDITLMLYSAPTKPSISGLSFLIPNHLATFECRSKPVLHPANSATVFKLTYVWYNKGAVIRGAKGRQFTHRSRNAVKQRIAFLELSCVAIYRNLPSKHSRTKRVEFVRSASMRQSPQPAYARHNVTIQCLPHLDHAMRFSSVKILVACYQNFSVQHESTIQRLMSSGNMGFSLSMKVDKFFNRKTCTCSAGYFLNGSYQFVEETALTLDIYYEPEIDRVLLSPTLPWMAGERNSSLTCVVNPGNPPDTNVKWLCDHDCADIIDVGENVFESALSRARTESQFNDRLIFTREVRENDDGREFTCVAENEYSRRVTHVTNLPIKIHVYYGPLLNIRHNDGATIQPGSIMDVPAGQPLSLSCDVRSNPPLQSLTWSVKNEKGIRIIMGEEYNIESLSSSDTGSYSCRANNTRSYNESTLSVRVLYLNVSLLSAHSSVQENERDVELICSVEGYPISFRFLRWQFNSSHDERIRNAPINDSRHRLSIFGGSQRMQINKVSYRDAGNYTCTVTNEHMTVTSAPVTLDVLYAPKVVETSSSDGVIGIKTGESPLLTLNVLAIPPEVLFIWKRVVTGNRAAEEVRRTRTRKFSDQYEAPALSYKNMSMVKYVVAVSNAIGSIDFTFSFKPQGPPMNPNGIGVVSTLPTQLSLSWTPGFDGGFDQRFFIEYWVEANPNERNHLIVAEDALSMPVVLRDLRPATSYIISLKGITDYGGGSETATYEIRHQTSELPRMNILSDVPLCVRFYGNAVYTDVRMRICYESTPECLNSGFNVNSDHKYCLNNYTDRSYRATVEVMANKALLLSRPVNYTAPSIIPETTTRGTTSKLPFDQPSVVVSTLAKTEETKPTGGEFPDERLMMVIAIVCAVVFIMLILSIIVTAFVCRRHKREKSNDAKNTSPTPPLLPPRLGEQQQDTTASTGVELAEGRWHSFKPSEASTLDSRGLPSATVERARNGTLKTRSPPPLPPVYATSNSRTGSIRSEVLVNRAKSYHSGSAGDSRYVPRNGSHVYASSLTKTPSTPSPNVDISKKPVRPKLYSNGLTAYSMHSPPHDESEMPEVIYSRVDVQRPAKRAPAPPVPSVEYASVDHQRMSSSLNREIK